MDVGGQRSDIGGRIAEQIKSAKELRVYKKAYDLAMKIFILSKTWPAEEKYSLTDQIRRASRSVCTNLREAWAKRGYEAHFISKLTDADGESSETDTWLDFALDCNYLTVEDHALLTEDNRAIGAMIGAMLNDPHHFLTKKPL
jgi:four helix bundle protein